MKRSLSLATLVFAAAALTAASGYAGLVSLHATIDGSQENPATESDAVGRAVMHYNTETNTFDLIVTLHQFTETLLASHIHSGFADENGGVVVGLGGESEYKRGKRNLILKVKRAVYLGEPEELLAGGTYLNFHTATYPNGAVRGQLIPDRIEFLAVADGLQEVPPNASTATGVTLATYHPRRNTIDLSITLMNFDNTLVASHIHEAPPGVNGGIVVGLGSEDDAYERDGSFLEAEFRNLIYDPDNGDPLELMKGNAYVNFHTPEFPGGEIRGQLEVVVPNH